MKIFGQWVRAARTELKDDAIKATLEAIVDSARDGRACPDWLAERVSDAEKALSSKAAEASGGQATINGILWLCYHALKQSQWTNVCGFSHLCPYCNAAEVDGHDKDCMAGNALRMMQEQLDQETAIMKTQMAAPEADEIERHYAIDDGFCACGELCETGTGLRRHIAKVLAGLSSQEGK